MNATNTNTVSAATATTVTIAQAKAAMASETVAQLKARAKAVRFPFAAGTTVTMLLDNGNTWTGKIDQANDAEGIATVNGPRGGSRGLVRNVHSGMTVLLTMSGRSSKVVGTVMHISAE